MNESSAFVVINAVLPVFCAAGAGVLMRKVNWLTEEADKSLLRMTINFLMPCLIFVSIFNNEAFRQVSNLILPPIVGFATVALGVGVAWLVRRRTGLSAREGQNTFAYTVGVYNYGYVPIPLAYMLFGRETAGVLLVHNVGVEVAMWLFAFAMLGGKGERVNLRKLLNPPLVTIIVVLLIDVSGAHRYVPEFVQQTAQMLGQCALPMGLVLIGAIIADHLHEFHAKQGWSTMFLSCALRLGVLPMVFLVIAKFLPAPVELKRVMLLQAAMPAAVFPIVLAKHYNGDPPTAVRIVMATSAVSIITIPLWLRFGRQFIGL